MALPNALTTTAGAAVPWASTAIPAGISPRTTWPIGSTSSIAEPGNLKQSDFQAMECRYEEEGEGGSVLLQNARRGNRPLWAAGPRNRRSRPATGPSRRRTTPPAGAVGGFLARIEGFEELTMTSFVPKNSSNFPLRADLCRRRLRRRNGRHYPLRF